MLGYALTVADLLSCPFCRELFRADEGHESCPECGVELKPMHELPPSLDALAEEEPGVVVAPEERLLPLGYLGRGRGALLLLSVLGLGLFFAPWVDLVRPNAVLLSGFDLARGRAGWLWGGALGYFIMIPLVLSRRSVAKMRGVRVIGALFAAMTAGEVLMLMSLPPNGSRFVPVEFSWAWGLYASAAVSVAAVVVAARFGGRVDDLPAVSYRDARGTRREESSAGETLH